jgi:hypothetical protein
LPQAAAYAKLRYVLARSCTEGQTPLPLEGVASGEFGHGSKLPLFG